MVGKKGYLRILEALIAVILIFGFFLFLNLKDPDVDLRVPLAVGESQRIILDIIATNDSFVECVVDYEVGRRAKRYSHAITSISGNNVAAIGRRRPDEIDGWTSSLPAKGRKPHAVKRVAKLAESRLIEPNEVSHNVVIADPWSYEQDAATAVARDDVT